MEEVIGSNPICSTKTTAVIVTDTAIAEFMSIYWGCFFVISILFILVSVECKSVAFYF